MRILILAFAILVLQNIGFAQKAAVDPHSLIVQAKAGYSSEDVLGIVQSFALRTSHTISVRLLSKNLNTYKIHVESEALIASLKQKLKETNHFEAVQHNHIITKRNTPNDSLFINLWHLENNGSNGPQGAPSVQGADIGVLSVWDENPGYTNTLGDTVVVCIIDDGIDINHEDFQGNLFKNYLEIPDNGIDDDTNGFVDDYHAWNSYAQNGTTQGPASFDDGRHGTHVSGVAGAKGNNGIGVTGVAQNVKIMTVVGGGDEAEAIAAYDYPLTMRKLYNETNGAKGAYVVATNASWGTDFGKPQDAPIWCNIYDSLGQAGILNTAATINSNINIDVQGDLPTTCPSEYLVAVTSTDHRDEKVTFAGYGPIHIDLGAPGEGVYSTNFGSDYGYDDGTSFAAPMVAGTIGLLYSYACDTFIQVAQQSPEMAAGFMKRFLLDGAEAKPTLSGITVTGGRLDVEGAAFHLYNFCVGIIGMDEAKSTSEVLIYPNPSNGFFMVDGIEPNTLLEIYDLNGRLVKSNIIQPQESVDVSGLKNGIFLVKLELEKGVKWRKILCQ